MKKSILILVLSDLKHDARVRRQINSLKDLYEVTVVCFQGEPSKDYRLITLPPPNLTLRKKIVSSIFLITGFYSVAFKILHSYTTFIYEAISGKKFDLVIANDVETLPVAFQLAGKPKVLFDAHEYAPRHFEDKLMWRIFFRGFNTWLCEKYIPRTSGMTTVGRMLALEYEKYFKVRPTVITNANNYSAITPSDTSDDNIKLVHHGIATPSRNLHLMLELMDKLDSRFSLDMYLLTPGFASRKTADYIELLKQKAAHHPRVRILPPVKGDEIIQTINRYDLGIFLLPPVNFNYRNTLPNKLFDFIQARLGIAIGPTPEMADIVRNYDNGVVADDFTAQGLANKLAQLTTAEIRRFKKNSNSAAMDLNAEKNKIILQQLVSSIIPDDSELTR